MQVQRLTEIDRARSGQDGADDGRAERCRQQTVRDATAISCLGRKIVVHVYRVEIVRRLSELANSLFGHHDALFSDHPDAKFFQDIAAGGVCFDHTRHD